jgi:hypothetical protein
MRPLREVLFWRLFRERRLRRTGRFELALVPTMDHVLLVSEGRRVATRLLTAHVLDRFASVGRCADGEGEAGTGR